MREGDIIRRYFDSLGKGIAAYHFFDGQERDHSNLIYDSSLSRILKLHTSIGFASVTSYQAKTNRSINQSLLRDMMEDIYRSGYGYFEVDGTYENNQGVKEFNKSLIVPNKVRPNYKGNVEDFESMLIRLMQDAHYQSQESILLSKDGEGFLIFPDGSKVSLGELNFNKDNPMGETVLSYGESGKSLKKFTFMDEVKGATNSVNSFYYGKYHIYQSVITDRESGELIGYGFCK